MTKELFCQLPVLTRCQVFAIMLSMTGRDPFALFNNCINLVIGTPHERHSQVRIFMWFDKLLDLLSNPPVSLLASNPAVSNNNGVGRLLGSILSSRGNTKRHREMKDQTYKATKEKLKSIINDEVLDKENPNEQLILKALDIIVKLKDLDFLPDLIKRFIRGGDYQSVNDKVFQTLLELDPDFTNTDFRNAVITCLRTSPSEVQITKALSDSSNAKKFDWLKVFVEEQYSNKDKELQQEDLIFLYRVSGLKPKIADYSEQLAGVFMMNQGDDSFMHATIDVLNRYFYSTGNKYCNLIDDHIARISLSNQEVHKSLIRKMKHYIGVEQYPSWNSDDRLKSEFLDLSKKNSKPDLYRLGSTTLQYDETGKPKYLQNLVHELNVTYHYNNGLLTGVLVKYQNVTYPFILEGDKVLSFADLPDNPMLYGKTSYPSMKLLDGRANEPTGYSINQPFVFREPGKFVLYPDGCIQIHDGQTTFIFSPIGSIHISHDDRIGFKEFITQSGDYHYLESNYNE